MKCDLLEPAEAKDDQLQMYMWDASEGVYRIVGQLLVLCDVVIIDFIASTSAKKFAKQ